MSSVSTPKCSYENLGLTKVSTASLEGFEKVGICLGIGVDNTGIGKNDLSMTLALNIRDGTHLLFARLLLRDLYSYLKIPDIVGNSSILGREMRHPTCVRGYQWCQGK